MAIPLKLETAMADQVLVRSSDEEALRLVLAFYCIMEPEKRDQVMALAERYAGTPPAADDVSVASGRPVRAADQ